MLFNSYNFLLIFLPTVYLLFLITNVYQPKFNGIILLSASLIFYGYWNVNYLFLLLGSIIINYWIGKNAISKLIFYFGIFINLIVLFYFKYSIFVLGIFINPNEANQILGTIILPLGISFYTFQQISFLVDIHRRQVTVPKLFSTYAAYVSFFPQLVAGPIVRYHDINKKLDRLLKGISAKRVLKLTSSGLALFSLGLFKKVCIADPLSYYSNPVFDSINNSQLSTLDALIGLFAYTFQLYFDFSAYSDMAIGLGRMFGLILPMNFNSPYKSTSVIEFWRRWHISLSFFVRDYVYIPLGGNKFGLPRQIFNLLFAFIIIGFWHGAGYMFITWGVYHGALIVINYIIRHLKIPKLPKLLSISFTFFLVVIGWSLFRVGDITQLENLYISIFSFTEGKTIFLEVGQQKLGIGLIIISAIITFLFPNTLEIIGLRWHGLLHGKKITMYKRLSRKVLLPILIGISLYFSVTSLEGFNSKFLYFNF